MRVCCLICISLSLGLAVACSGGAEGEGDHQQTPSPLVGKDGRHPLAEKPLKTFANGKSEQWKKEEARKMAEQRAKAYKYKHKVEARPTSPDPFAGRPFGLEEALAGIDGAGPVKAVFETTEGEFTCVLDTKGNAAVVAHFIGLARGLRPWWDSARGEWSTAAFYTAIPVYKVIQGEAFYSGCPMAIGFAEVGFRTLAPLETLDPADEPYELALITPSRVPSFGPQFVVSAKSDPKIEERNQVIGRCEGAGPIQKIAGKELTKSGRPVDDVLIRRVRIER